MRKTNDYHEFLIKGLKDPEEAAEYLTQAIEEGDKEMFLLALRDVAEAHGGMIKLSRNAKLNKANLYKMLSKNGNPEITSLETILETLGFRLAVVPKERTKMKKAA